MNSAGQTQSAPARDPADSIESEKQQRALPDGSTTLVVRPGASFEGLLTCPNAARIEGRFVGKVYAAGRIEIGEGAIVSGRIQAQDIVIAGRFKGELSATRCISLLATARVEGELCARELVAEEGCTVTGRCRTLPAS